jgi:hypothetical protein
MGRSVPVQQRGFQDGFSAEFGVILGTASEDISSSLRGCLEIESLAGSFVWSATVYVVCLQHRTLQPSRDLGWSQHL